MSERFYEQPVGDARRSAPAALRNRDPIAEVLSGWLPERGLVLEVASGTGEHAVHFARRFPDLEWQPSDPDPTAIESITAWRAAEPLANLRPPLKFDVRAPEWPIGSADAVLSINMVHISPWEAALGLLDGAGRLLKPEAPLILYGPWVVEGVETAESNLAFDSQLRARDPRWGLRRVEEFRDAAAGRDFELMETQAMPANNRMLLFRKRRRDS